MCRYSVVKLHEATQMFLVVDYVRKMTVKKSCKCGEYGSFYHLLLVFFITIIIIIIITLVVELVMLRIIMRRM